jgi:hypothetical protein
MTPSEPTARHLGPRESQLSIHFCCVTPKSVRTISTNVMRIRSANYKEDPLIAHERPHEVFECYCTLVQGVVVSRRAV